MKYNIQVGHGHTSPALDLNEASACDNSRAVKLDHLIIQSEVGQSSKSCPQSMTV